MLRNYLQQVENNLVTLKPCTLILSFEDYMLNDNMMIFEEENFIWVKSLIGKIDYENQEPFDIILDYAVNIFIENMKIIKKDSIILTYSRESNILEITTETEDISKQTNYVERLLGGKELFKDADHLFLKLYNIFGDISDMDLVHMEVLISNVLRDKAKPAQPARLGKVFDPVGMNLKNIVFAQSKFLSSLNFENINKSILTGIINKDEPEESSIMEKILLNEIIVKK